MIGMARKFALIGQDGIVHGVGSSEAAAYRDAARYLEPKDMRSGFWGLRPITDTQYKRIKAGEVNWSSLSGSNRAGGKRTAKRSSNRAGMPKRSARTGRFLKAR